MNRSFINYLVVFVLIIAGAAKILSYVGQEQGIGVEGNVANAGLIPVLGLLGMHIFSYMLIVTDVAVTKGLHFVGIKVLKDYPIGQKIIKIAMTLILIIIFVIVSVDLGINLIVWGGL